MDEKTIARFWKKVDRRGPDECWEWQSCKSSAGYGEFLFDRRKRRAHRIAWRIANGFECPVSVLHRCDNRKCCNPAHLFAGTQTDNIADMVSKGRARSGRKPGQQFPHHVATPEIAREIRRIWGSRPTQATLAEMFGVSQGTVSLIVRGKIWRESE